MSSPWAVQLPRASARAAGMLRLRPGVRACEAGDVLWLRGDDLDEALDLELRKLPGARRYSVNPDDTVTEVGRRLPSAELPDTPWFPLSTWLTPQPQPAALAGDHRQARDPRCPVRLLRSDGEQTPTVLVVMVADFAAYAAAAPAVRLRPLLFAAASDGRVVLWGAPLPPLPGRRFAESGGVAVACGFAWSPALEPQVLGDLLGLAGGDLALFEEDGSYEHIAAGSFARATRAAARATLEALHRGGTAP